MARTCHAACSGCSSPAAEPTSRGARLRPLNLLASCTVKSAEGGPASCAVGSPPAGADLEGKRLTSLPPIPSVGAFAVAALTKPAMAPSAAVTKLVVVVPVAAWAVDASVRASPEPPSLGSGGDGGSAASPRWTLAA